MRRILVIISCMLSTFMAMAQEYNLRWISSPCVDSTAQIWFRNQYVHHKKIKKALYSKLIPWSKTEEGKYQVDRVIRIHVII